MNFIFLTRTIYAHELRLGSGLVASTFDIAYDDILELSLNLLYYPVYIDLIPYIGRGQRGGRADAPSPAPRAVAFPPAPPPLFRHPRKQQVGTNCVGHL